jgi:hypothetical protein
MSNHLIDNTALLDLPPSKKLVLLCLADGADRVTRKVSPGLDNIMQWSGLKKSRALGVIAELIADGLLVRVTAGQPGRMAEFVVLPGGCCVSHGALDVTAVDGAGKPKPPTKTPGSAESDPRREDNGSAESDPRGSDNGSDNGSDSHRTPSVSPISTPLPTGESAHARTHAGAHTREADDDPPQLALVAEPEEPAEPAKGRRAKTARVTRARIPRDWVPSPKLWKWTEENAPGIPRSEVAQFIDKHWSRGDTFADFDAAWQYWARNWVTFGSKGSTLRGSRPGSSSREPYRDRIWEDGTADASWDSFMAGGKP